jgi:Holliday junction DNA helicase RuvA
MITYLEGLLDEKHPTRTVLDVGGVGYEVFIPLSSYDRLPDTGKEVRIHIFDHLREDAHTLFGFSTLEERRMFELLLSISGIGPKLALSALSGMTVRELKAAVVEGNVKRLSSISGLGKKTAERIVVELRDKLGKGEAMEAMTAEDDAGDVTLRDAVLALISLGYKQEPAQKMVRQVLAREGGAATVEEIVKQALGGS